MTKKYLFHVNRCGKKENKNYKKRDVDIFALVGIDNMTIGYIKSELVKKTMFFLPDGSYPVRSSFEKKEAIKKMFSEGRSLSEISNLFSVDKSYCIRVRDGKENKNFARNYLSDYKIEDCLC